MPVPGSGARPLAETLAEQEAVWRRRPLLRRLYGEWFDLIGARLARVEGRSVELGSGFAPLKQRLPELEATDVEATPWVERVVDAHALPYDDGSLANLVAVDVVHHLAEPPRFLDEVRRTLRPGGRLVALEPYTSPLSTIAYRRFHHERTDPDADPFAADPALAAAAMEGNQALPTLIFFRHADGLRARWPELALVERLRLSFLLYPLSGGFSRPQLVPDALYRPLRALERALAPAAPLLAFRCLVVLERQAGEPSGR
jgi:SAM-dependent methyltransferase